MHWQALGQTSATLAKVRQTRLPLLRKPVALAVVAVGVNDTVFMTRESQFRRDVRAMVDALHTIGAAHVVFSGVPPMDRFPALPQPMRAVLGVRSRLLDALLREELTERSGASYAQIKFPDAPGHMASDGFHASERGYALWARQLADHVRGLRLPLLSTEQLGEQATGFQADSPRSLEAAPS